MVHLDTNFLIEAVVVGKPAEMKVLEWMKAGENIGISSIAWSEFLCGPLPPDAERLSFLFLSAAEPFLSIDAKKAAELFNCTGRRSRSLADCQIASVALRLNARLATANAEDFRRFEEFGLVLA